MQSLGRQQQTLWARVLIAVLLVLVVAPKVRAQTAWIECDQLALPRADVGALAESRIWNPEVIELGGEIHVWFHAQGTNGEVLAHAASAAGFCTLVPDLAPFFVGRPNEWDINIQDTAVLPFPEDGAMGVRMFYGAGRGNQQGCDVGFATGDVVGVQRFVSAPVVDAVPGNWEQDCILNPSVIEDGPLLRMWYDGGSDQSVTWRIGYAESTDGGLTWTRSALNPVLRPGGEGGNGVLAPEVLYDPESETYEMWYGVGGRRPFVSAYATSMDGKVWEKGGVLEWEGPTRAAGVGHPTVLRRGNTYHMYATAGGPNNWLGLAYATSEWTRPRASFVLTGADVDPDTEHAAGITPLTITVDAAKSLSPADGGIAAYAWDFGDGNTAEGMQAEHTYEAFGQFRVTLTVTDTAENTGRVARLVQVLFPSESVDPWESRDIGEIDAQGGARMLEGECLEVAHLGGGTVTSREDNYHSLHQQFTGDFRVEVAVPDPSPLTQTDRAGLMARESLDPDARNVFMHVRSTSVRVSRREEAGATTRTNSVASHDDEPLRLRLERRGDTLTGFVSRDGGVNWEPAPPVEAIEPLPEELYVGIALGGGTPAAPAAIEVCELTLGPAPELPQFRRGDSNADGDEDLTDGVSILNFLFLGRAAPPCEDAADANDSGQLDIADASYIFSYLFLGEAAPPAPYPSCGVDTTADVLECATSGCP